MAPAIPKGFRHTPITKLFLLFNIAVPVLISLSNTKHWLFLQFDPFVFQWNQPWRILLNPIAFTNESQVFISSIIVYQLRTLERLQGPHRFVSFLVLIYAAHIVCQTAANFIAKLFLPDGWNWLAGFNYATGPFPVLGALLYQFYALIPAVYCFEITDILPNPTTTRANATTTENNDEHQHQLIALTRDIPKKITLNDKAFIYLFSIQIALSEGLDSLIPITTGWILSFLMSSGIIPGKYWKLPFFNQIYKFFYKTSRSRNILTNANTSISMAGTTAAGTVGAAGTAAGANANVNDAEIGDVDDRLRSPESDTEPVRPLATQFLDSIRR